MVEFQQLQASQFGTNMHPLLILDIDGVMNTVTGMSLHKSKAVFTSDSVIALRRIVQATDCCVVISSSWRVDQWGYLQDVFVNHGLDTVRDRIIGCTPVLDPFDNPTREDEIGCWLNTSRYSGRLAILDDEEVFGELSPWHVRIKDSVGLEELTASHAVKLLTEGQPFSCWS
jgi:HAD domain in Swiss Army Knife RNA repair proteins